MTRRLLAPKSDGRQQLQGLLRGSVAETSAVRPAGRRTDPPCPPVPDMVPSPTWGTRSRRGQQDRWQQGPSSQCRPNRPKTACTSRPWSCRKVRPRPRRGSVVPRRDAEGVVVGVQEDLFRRAGQFQQPGNLGPRPARIERCSCGSSAARWRPGCRSPPPRSSSSIRVKPRAAFIRLSISIPVPSLIRPSPPRMSSSPAAARRRRITCDQFPPRSGR